MSWDMVQLQKTVRGDGTLEQRRTVSAPEGEISYRLIKKRVKNLNLRLERGGEVVLSAPLRCPAERADAFILEKSGWIFRHISQREETPLLLPEIDRRVCVCLLSEAVERVYPLVAAAKKERIEAVRPGVGVMEKHAGPACVPAPLLLYEFIEKR